MTRTREENAADLAHDEEVRNRNHPVCTVCGSDEVQFDAYVQWDREVQDWSVTFVAEKPVLCEGECGGNETTVTWIEEETNG